MKNLLETLVRLIFIVSQCSFFLNYFLNRFIKVMSIFASHFINLVISLTAMNLAFFLFRRAREGEIDIHSWMRIIEFPAAQEGSGMLEFLVSRSHREVDGSGGETTVYIVIVIEHWPGLGNGTLHRANDVPAAQ